MLNYRISCPTPSLSFCSPSPPSPTPPPTTSPPSCNAASSKKKPIAIWTPPFPTTSLWPTTSTKTAIFRLGECYRKLGRTNEAVAQYQRIVREFSDQQTLATLSQQNLAGLGAV